MKPSLIAIYVIMLGIFPIYSEPGDSEIWIKPLKVWDNLEGGRQIVSWQENQI